ncbi:MAG TPA: Flp pilus assembly protein CpaB [Terriglobales bacterium]|jgi:pilus assembly protein CpaB
MKRKRLLGIAVVALALAGIATLAALRLARRQGAAATVAVVPVVAAAGPLAPGARLQATDLEMVDLPPGALPQHVFHRVADLTGRVITAQAVAHQVIVGEMIAAPGSGVGLPPLIPAGMRAVSVKVNDVVSVAGFAVPGTHVDVLLTGNPAENSDPRQVTTITLLSNVQVLTAGQQLLQNPNGKPQTVTVITLLVSPEGAEKLALADGYGHIQLSLRNPLDGKSPATAPLLNGTLYRGVSTPANPRTTAPRRAALAREAAPQAWPVVLIEGGTQQTLKFPAAMDAGGDPR